VDWEFDPSLLEAREYLALVIQASIIDYDGVETGEGHGLILAKSEESKSECKYVRVGYLDLRLSGSNNQRSPTGFEEWMWRGWDERTITLI
jgi:hypothetical protein